MGGCGDGDGDRIIVAPPPQPGATAFGFNDRPDPTSVRLQTRTGAPLRRFRVPWNEVEAVRGRWDWSGYDARYELIRAAGLRPLPVAIGAPCWTRPGRRCSPGPPDPGFEGAWAEYVRRLAERYPEAVGVEIWNEPNIVPMFPPYPDPDRFGALLEAAHSAVKGVDPELPVVLGGLFAAGRSGSYGLADASFLSALFEAGAGDSIDAIGAHPYPRAGSPGAELRYDLAAMDQALDRLRRVRDAAGHPDTPIWITEIGISTASARGFPPGASESEQAELLLASLNVAERDEDVQVAIVHRLLDTPASSARTPLAVIETGFGVFDSNGAPKRAACALSEKLRGSLAC